MLIKDFGLEKDKVVRDAVHGDIELTGTELEITNTPEFQRLDRIKQLGTAYKIYRTANHTRFDHSLGVVHTVTKIAESLQANENVNESITTRKMKAIRLAALLHDLPHVPFGHTLEDEGNLISDHETRFEKFISGEVFEGKIEEILRDPEVNLFNAVMWILTDNDDYKDDSEVRVEKYMQNMLHNTICADILDYLKRDAYFCGLVEPYDERIFKGFEIQEDDEGEKRLAIRLWEDGDFRDDLFYSIIEILRSRFQTVRQVSYHHTKVKLDAMLIGAVSFALENGMNEEDLYDWGNQGLIRKLEKEEDYGVGAKKLAERVKDRKITGGDIIDQINYRELTESGYRPEQIVNKLSESTEEEKRLNFKGIRSMERKIEAKCGLEGGSVIIFCPERKMQLKPAEVPIITNDDRLMKLNDFPRDIGLGIKSEVETYETAYRRLWSAYILLEPGIRKKTGEPKIVRECWRSMLDLPMELKTSEGVQDWGIFSIENLDILEDFDAIKKDKKNPENEKRRKIIERLWKFANQEESYDAVEGILEELSSLPKDANMVDRLKKAVEDETEESPERTEERVEKIKEKIRGEGEKDQ